MAKKKEDAMQNEANVQMEQEAQANALVNQMAEINAIEEQTKIREQEMNNKTHDTEFSQFTEASGNSLNNITTEDVQKAYQVLMKYKEEKADLEHKIIENEDFWKMNHWDVVYKGGEKHGDKRVKPKSAWLFNLIINKHADAMDNYPEADILPRARDDEETAEQLSQIIPVVMEQNNYEDVYSDAQWYKCKNGTSVQGVFWNNDKDNGLGNIDIKKIDILNLFWKFSVSDIEDSPNVFYVKMMANDEIKSMYPEINVGGTNSLGLSISETYKTGADATDETAVIDWYYKKRVKVQDELGVPKINTVLHYCKFCNEQIIYASENDPNYAERGWYDHGKYPFVFDTLFPIEGNVCGIGYIDIEKDDQIFIDKMQQAILESAVTNARPRYFFNTSGQVNEEEFLDLSNPIIHVDGRIADDNIVPVANSVFNATYESILLNKIEELKDTSGNTAASQGISSSGQSGSAIASLQEAAGKLARDSNNTSYRAFKKVVELVIELIRQFYDEPRCFRILGDKGENQFVSFDNTGLLPQAQGSAMGINLGSRLPIMDIEVKPQKRNAYSKEGQNQTALNLYSMGFFAPNNADSSLACLDMMDFDQIEKVKDNVSMNGTLYQQVQMLMQQNMQLMAMLQGGSPQDVANAGNVVANAQQGNNQPSGGQIQESKGSLSSQAAEASRGSTAPR